MILQADRTSSVSLYTQIYEYYREEICSRRLREGERLPSIRGLAQQLGVSKMTVEQAFYQLVSEGYIVCHNRSRYRVAPIAELPAVLEPQASYLDSGGESERLPYDLAAGNMDESVFSFALWRRYVNRVYRETSSLYAYGSEEGERPLREAVSAYAHRVRGVAVSPQQVVIGAGTQVLVRILASLLRERYDRIAVEDPGFAYGREIFRDEGYRIVPVPVPAGNQIETLRAQHVRLLYLSPSHQFPTGQVMPIGQRQTLLAWAAETGGIILEDDYDSELRYYGRPIPAMQGLDRAGNVVYMGSFSKVLPPSMRISYMVLPEPLLLAYRKKKYLYRQTVSVVEQLALAEYIRAGELEKQIRRLRKFYQEKGSLFLQLLTKYFGSEAVLDRRLTSGVYCRLRLESDLSSAELVEKAAKEGCRVKAVEYIRPGQEGREKEFLLSFSTIRQEEMERAVQALCRAWKG